VLRLLRIAVDFAALDRLVDYLEAQAQEQAEINALRQQVEQLTNTLAQHRSSLKTAIEKET
jgi:hypothetical protein